KDLEGTYGIRLAKASAAADKFNWKEFSLQKRQDVQGKLAHYLQLINRILEIDAAKLITIENRAQLISNRESAEAFQRSVEGFVSSYGESFNPKSGAEPNPRHVSENE